MPPANGECVPPSIGRLVSDYFIPRILVVNCSLLQFPFILPIHSFIHLDVSIVYFGCQLVVAHSSLTGFLFTLDAFHFHSLLYSAYVIYTHFTGFLFRTLHYLGNFI